ncbi:MAG: T9SS type A sorting domain-containing protein [Candidatus Cloacimonadales bacterium]|nr:T9SS type A sorting domain-containing protein [Candidatus Cloacimonadales bacterium]
MKKIFILNFLILVFVGLYAGTPHPVYIGVTNPNGAVTWQAWNLAAPSDILTQGDTGCSWNATQNLVSIQCGTFTAQWNPGETIHVEAVDATSASDTYEFILTTAGFQYFPDAMTLVPSGPIPPSLATLVAPSDGSIIPPEMVLLDWAYSGEAVTGFEVWLGLADGDAAEWIADVTNGDTEYNVGNLAFSADFEWFIKPYIETTSLRAKKEVRKKIQKISTLRGGREDRTYPADPIVTWTFSIFDPTPPPPPPVVPAGGGTSFFAFNGGIGTGGAGSTISFTPPANGGTGAVAVSVVDPATTGLPNPENTAFVYNIIGYNGDFPIHLVFEWDYPAPAGISLPLLLVSTDGGNTFVDVETDSDVQNVVWNLVTPPYSVGFDTFHLSEWAAGNGEDNPLPVSLSSFSGMYDDNAPVLRWTTQSETDNLGWNIYRGLAENGFETGNNIQINANLIDGMGICTEPTDYSFVDEYPVVEGVTYWYWLESVSTTNELEQHGPVSIEIPIQGEIPNAVIETYLNNNYPNPFNPRTTINFNIEEGETGKLTIYNVKGQAILAEIFESGEYTFEWNAEGVSSGIYFYRLTTPTMDITKKMILMK